MCGHIYARVRLESTSSVKTYPTIQTVEFLTQVGTYYVWKKYPHSTRRGHVTIAITYRCTTCTTGGWIILVLCKSDRQYNPSSFK